MHKKTSSVVHYGAYVMIQHDFSAKQKGYLYSDGFVHKRLVLKQFSDSTQEDIFGSVFRILPPFRYDLSDRLKSLLKGQEKSGGKFSKANLRSLTAMSKSVISEMRLNIDYFHKTKQTAVGFSKALQFQHMKSQKYLMCKANEN